MGKKSKKFNKTQDPEVPSTCIGKLEPEDVNFKIITSEINSNAKNTSTDSVKKSKKKNRKRDLNGDKIQDVPEQINNEEIIESNELGSPTSTETKKKKNKKHTKLNEEVHSDTDVNILDKDQPDVPKKKKKKGKLLHEEDTPKIENCDVKEQQKHSKENKNQDSLLNEPSLDRQAPNKQNEDTNQKKKKGKKKAKTGAPVLNDEESQVTDEDIDRFIDEIDEEDNKQYEDWVKLLDARLSKKQQTE